ncbi:hypothetical protein ASG30_19110 [Ramlibacter sp. Leaf400]|nr:hypothetical protein ASG30_19110 [Ramlibacter sp. Leaf400]
MVPDVPAPPEGPPAVVPIPQVLTWGEFPEARVVLGQQGFDQGDAPVDSHQLDRLDTPTGSPAVMADGRLFVAARNAIKVFTGYDALSGAAAEFELAGNAFDVSTRDGNLVVMAFNNALIYNSAPADALADHDIVVGNLSGFPGCADDKFNHPQAAYITPLGKLIVADTLNHRVLIWSKVPEAGEGADFVIGQGNKNICQPNDRDENGTGEVDPNEKTLRDPSSVWSDDRRLVVADRGNNRVLIWETFPDGDFRPATRVVGQASFTEGRINAGQGEPSSATLFAPGSVDVRESGQMAVADTGNSRVLVWDTFPEAQFGQVATQVIGQRDFAGGTGNAGGDVPAANTLRGPTGVRFDGRNLVVVDKGNHRVLVFRSTN